MLKKSMFTEFVTLCVWLRLLTAISTKINNVVEICGELCVVLCLLAVPSQGSEWVFCF